MPDQEGEEVVDLKAGDKVHYIHGTEPTCRPATILSDGICERVKRGGNWLQFAHLSVGSEDSPATRETTREWDGIGRPNTWHLPGECPRHA